MKSLDTLIVDKHIHIICVNGRHKKVSIIAISVWRVDSTFVCLAESFMRKVFFATGLADDDVEYTLCCFLIVCSSQTMSERAVIEMNVTSLLLAMPIDFLSIRHNKLYVVDLRPFRNIYDSPCYQLDWLFPAPLNYSLWSWMVHVIHHVTIKMM